MRIISGTLKGRKIHAPVALPVRPTTDFAKEALFNILNNLVNFDDCEVLDLFAGTGNITYEFISRNVKSVLSVDINSKCVDFIKKAAFDLQLHNIKAIKMDAFAFIAICKAKYDIIFCDPPYTMDYTKLLEIPAIIFNQQLLNETGLLIIEHQKNISFVKHPNFFDQRHYGKVNFSFFKFENTT